MYKVFVIDLKRVLLESHLLQLVVKLFAEGVVVH
jgi:hypothetical protein